MHSTGSVSRSATSTARRSSTRLCSARRFAASRCVEAFRRRHAGLPRRRRLAQRGARACRSGRRPHHHAESAAARRHGLLGAHCRHRSQPRRVACVALTPEAHCMRRAERLFQLVHLTFGRRPGTAALLAERLGVSKRPRPNAMAGRAFESVRLWRSPSPGRRPRAPARPSCAPSARIRRDRPRSRR